ncbi:MAG: 1-(5-phosphoribosyl)-5-[(5-phosphoribosylamino)methylideneamino]imidazole-4-carboxamide isomerase [Sporomusaceae bacterium]|jgi:phosphoribosylformimino-5-aminoimidazole carboxamide ribotide isomerase|nr:1-(5-phosphoribosyl)-5-[(5-phosphoribosylamino)methylideneamino]imidazole-4-carboxamide isomerase [Sporomusaceae bacterium]
MIIFPAIDIRGGKCVRLLQGEFDKETVFGDDPVAMALKWRAKGAEFLHLVDLDGARAGEPVNLAVVRKIAAAVKIPVQLGGGIRTAETIETVLEAGVSRVILGSAAVKDPDMVRKAAAKYQEKIVVGIDAKDGRVKIDGWGAEGGVDAAELAAEMASIGAKRIIYTDIAKDGMLSGVNVEATVKLAQQAKIPVIASGGVKDINDIILLKEKEACGIEGVIVGKAIYTDGLDLAEALKISRN